MFNAACNRISGIVQSVAAIWRVNGSVGSSSANGPRRFDHRTEKRFAAHATLSDEGAYFAALAAGRSTETESSSLRRARKTSDLTRSRNLSDSAIARQLHS